MPLNTKFDPFRHFHRRSHSNALPFPSREDDSDQSSPERGRPHVPDDSKLSRSVSDRFTENAHKQPHPERLSSKAFKSGVACVAYPNDAVDTLKPPVKQTLIRRVTSKLNIAIPSRSNSELRPRPLARTLPSNTPPPLPKPTTASPPHPNSFVSKQHREAALRERGLLPPRKDLSEQEREADRRLGCAPSLTAPLGKTTEAEQLKQSWLALNKISEGSDPECQPQSSPPDLNALPRSSQGSTDLLPLCRTSCGSVPPLSTSSCLEVLHEESSEYGPITPPPPLFRSPIPVIVSSSPDSPPSPLSLESPVSHSVSSHYPGSTLESQSQSSYSFVPEKEFDRSRPRQYKVVGSKLGSRSFLNLRLGGLSMLSSSTLSTSDRSSSYAPRSAIDPTMHSLGSIVRETRNIEDVESRRLSELAFLN